MSLSDDSRRQLKYSLGEKLGLFPAKPEPTPQDARSKAELFEIHRNGL